MKYALVIFDLDGTILNTLEDLADSLNYVLARHQYPARSLNEVRSFLGDGIQKLIERSLPNKTDFAVQEAILRDFIEHYGLHCTDKTRPYTGIPELLGMLRSEGCKTAVVSNKADLLVQRLCSFYFSGLFDAAAGERTGVKRKPAPDAVNSVIESFGLTKPKTLLIGDSEVDAATAQNAGIECLIVGWGFRDADFLRQRTAKPVMLSVKELAANCGLKSFSRNP